MTPLAIISCGCTPIMVGNFIITRTWFWLSYEYKARKRNTWHQPHEHKKCKPYQFFLARTVVCCLVCEHGFDHVSVDKIVAHLDVLSKKHSFKRKKKRLRTFGDTRYKKKTRFQNLGYMCSKVFAWEQRSRTPEHMGCEPKIQNCVHTKCVLMSCFI